MRSYRRRKRRLSRAPMFIISALAFAVATPAIIEGWVTIAVPSHGWRAASEPGSSSLKKYVRMPCPLFVADNKKNLEGDVARKLSASSDRSQSSHSAPDSTVPSPPSSESPLPKKWKSKRRNGAGVASRHKSSQGLVPSSVESSVGVGRGNGTSSSSGGSRSFGSPASSKGISVSDSRKRFGNVVGSTNNSTSTYSSLLPPPITTDSNEIDGNDDPLVTGLSSWEEFLGVGSSSDSPVLLSSSSLIPARVKNYSNSQSRQSSKLREVQQKRLRQSSTKTYSVDESIPNVKLPPIQDLFPPGLASKPRSTSSSSSSSLITSTQSLDGVVPVSDLFYRSTPPDDDDYDVDDLEDDASSPSQPPSNARKESRTSKHESLVGVRNSAVAKKSKNRKMVRKGMEMLVGGVPIHADPPHRRLELSYDSSGENQDWARSLSINTLDFGPLLHTASIPYVTNVERGLYLEHLCHSTLKWDICPKDLREIVRSYTRQPLPESSLSSKGSDDSLASSVSNVLTTAESLSAAVVGMKAHEDMVSGSNGPHPTHDEEDDDYNEALSIQVRPRESPTPTKRSAFDDRRLSSRRTTSVLSEAKGFGRKHGSAENEEGDRQVYDAVTELVFDMSVSRVDLESGDLDEEGQVLKIVLMAAFRTVCFEDLNGFSVEVSKLVLTDKGDGTTGIDVEFKISNERPMSLTHVQKRLKRISATFLQAVDEGVMLLAIASYAKLQSMWPLDVRERVAEDCLREDDEPDELNEDPIVATLADTPSLLLTRPLSREDLYVGGGVDGVFPDYSEPNKLNSPYRGEIGLRLVDAVSQRAKERFPRVIAIGDVHGCIDELQDLLRQCDYRPGDVVVFLGDLVCKGPDSISVVQMAREIGAIGVRGNHDFEVIRWHHAIKSGVEPPVVGSEHFHIASCLTKADMKWMHTLPWFMSSKDLGALFVHAGFVSGIRLARQNPRLLMNMRSILPDGTVTSKFFNNWPWARLWDGPQTVLFGHDADRGLQQYEHAIGLDTGCVYGGRLTACILPEKKLVSVSARRKYFKYRRKQYD